MKQQIKCPHCKKLFPIEESLKYEAEEFRKKLQKVEEQKSKERQKDFEEKLNVKLQKLNEAHEKEKEKIRQNAKKEQKTEMLRNIIIYFELHLQQFKPPKSTEILNEIFKTP